MEKKMSTLLKRYFAIGLSMTLSFSHCFSYNNIIQAQEISDQEQSEDKWVIGNETEQSIHFQLKNETNGNIVFFNIQPSGSENSGISLIPEAKQWASGDSRDAYFDMDVSQDVVDIWIGLEGKEEIKIESISLQDIHEQASIKIQEDQIYLEYISASTNQLVSSLVQEEVVEQEVGQHEEIEIIEQEKEEIKEQPVKQEETFEKIPVKKANTALEAAALAQTDEEKAFFEVNPQNGSTSLNTSISDLEGIDESYQEIVSSNEYSGSTSEKVEEAMEETGLYEAQENEAGVLEVVSVYAFKRILIFAPYQSSIQGYGAKNASYYKDCFTLTYETGESAQNAYEKLVNDFGVENVVIDIPMEIQESNTPQGWGYETMNFQPMVDMARGKSNIIVGVLDSGITLDHSIFAGTEVLEAVNIYSPTNPPIDEKKHGTAVAGIIAESTPENIQILPVRITNANGDTGPFTMMKGIDYCLEDAGVKVDVINISVGGVLEGTSFASQYETLINKMNEYASQNDIPIVVAAGNEGLKGKTTEELLQFPSTASELFSISAITQQNIKLSSSNYGSSVDFCAPGTSVKVADGNSGSNYTTKSGTSFAAPYVTAAIALLLAQNPDLTNEQIYQELVKISQDLGPQGRDDQYGHGLPVFDNSLNGFVKQDGKTYYYQDNKLVKGQKQIDSYWYMFDMDTGEMVKDDWYIHTLSTNPSGAKRVYYDKQGRMVFGWQTIEGKKYYFDPSTGELCTDKKKTIDGKDYYFDTKTGELLLGWQTIDGKRYYIDSTSEQPVKGLKTIENKKYYFDASSGVLQIGEITVGDKKYYSNSEGIIQTGVVEIKGKKYYFDENDGTLQKGLIEIGNKKYYSNSEGVIQTGFVTIKEKKYYFDASTGELCKEAKKTIEGKDYYFDTKTGELLLGWQTVDGKKYYIDPTSEQPVKGIITIDGKKHYFDASSGVLKTGWIENKKYYASSDGVLQTGFIKLSDNYYWLNSDGVRGYTGVVQNPIDKQWYFVRNGVGEKFTGWSKSIANGKWYFTRNGILDWSFTGIACSVENGNWYHGKNGELDWNYTGISRSVADGNWYFSCNGKLDWSFIGVAKSIADNNWYHCNNGKVNWNFTGISRSVADGNWYFSRNGKLDWSFTGVAQSIANGNWYFVRKGALDWNYTGGGKSIANGKWYAIQKGALNWNYKGTLTCTDGKRRNFKNGTAV